MCSRHNRFLAEQDYGAEYMARIVADHRRERTHLPATHSEALGIPVREQSVIPL